MYLIIFRVFLMGCCFSTNFALQINLYTSIGQIKQEVSVNNGYFETYLTNEEYNAIIPGTIDFSGQKVLEQDLYNSNEQLRNTDVYIRSKECGNYSPIKSKLVNPYNLLVKNDLAQYSYASREQIQFLKDPLMDGMILSVRLDNTLITKTEMTYLTRGLWWSPRYEVNVLGEQSATLRALADIHNEHERSYEITHSQLITGTVPLATTVVPQVVGVQYMMYDTASASSPITPKADATNFGTYSYNITRSFNLYPKSIKTYPFLNPTILFNYTLEATTYTASGTTSGLFQRIFLIQASEFLPAGIATFYLHKTGTCLGQGRFIDAAKNTEQKVSIGTDPDVQYTIKTNIITTRYSHPYGQDSDVNLSISNKKDKQTITVTLTITSGYTNTVLTLKKRSSSSITINQDPNNKSSLIIRATIKPDQEESLSYGLKQSH